jgi:ParB family chromosome partitioning protein
MPSAIQRPPAPTRSNRRSLSGARHRVSAAHARPLAPPDTNAPQQAAGLQALPLSSITSSSRNPRRRLLDVPELAASIQAYGLLQPVVVRPRGDAYVLLAGHRRVEAARSLGWETIPAIVRPATDDEAYLLTIVDNLQRQDLTPREESAALEVLVREHGWSTRQVAAAISRSQAFVSKRLRVFDDPTLGPAVLSNDLSVSAAEELLSVPADQRRELLKKIVRGKWDIGRVRQAARAARSGPDAAAVHQRRPALGRRLEELRLELHGLSLANLRVSERRQLRLLLDELEFVLPPLRRAS